MGVTVHTFHLLRKLGKVFLSFSNLDKSGTTVKETLDESLTFLNSFHGEVVFNNVGIKESFGSGSFGSSLLDLGVS